MHAGIAFLTVSKEVRQEIFVVLTEVEIAKKSISKKVFDVIGFKMKTKLKLPTGNYVMKSSFRRDDIVIVEVVHGVGEVVATTLYFLLDRCPHKKGRTTSGPASINYKTYFKNFLLDYFCPVISPRRK